MLFSSYLFVFLFLPPALCLYYCAPGRFRNGVLAVASYVFYGWANPSFMLLMFSTTVVDYTDGKLIARHPGRKKAFVTFSVLFDLLVLGYFKYFNFGMENYNALAGALGLESWQCESFLRVVLPLGISFYTFQSLSYVIDVYRGTAEPVRSFADYACYVSMFPQLVAGPIIRFGEVSRQLVARTHTREKFARGLAFFMLGMGKKVLLANPCGKVADGAFSAVDLPLADSWLGLFAYAFQIYFDFSGYSDMAVGLGLTLGFTFPKNFDSPFRSKSMPEYWRRWHISLSAWLKDYLFFPLMRSGWCMALTERCAESGHRKLAKALPAALALAIFWFVVGLWHGAAWTFVLFGLYHGVFIIFDVVKTACRDKKKTAPETVPAAKRIAGDVVATVATFIIACFGFVLFRADSLADAGRYFASLFGCPCGDPLPGTVLRVFLRNPYYAGIMAASAVIVWTMPQVWDFTKKLTVPKMAWCFLVFLLAVLALSVQSYNPFIYFIF